MKLKIAAFLFLAAVARADTLPDWHDGFGAPPAGLGLNGDPRALLAHDGSLYCGGSFNQAGPVTSWFLARLDRVNGSFAWTALGDLDNRVNALTAWGDSVLAGGRFTLVDGVDADRVAVWDGAAWHAVGDPAAWTWGHVSALAVIDGAPWAAGTGFVVRWNGSAWISMTGSGFTGDVFALAAYDGAPVMGGAFAVVPNPADDPTAAANVARWDGAMWRALGGGLGDTCYALAAWNGGLVAGGVFTSPAALAARWNGSGWSALGAGVVGTAVTALAPWGNRLAVGGDLTGAGSAAVSDLALYDGALWSDVTEGVDGLVRALAPWDGALAVGGGFTLVRGGTLESSHIGLWIDPTVGVDDAPAPLALHAAPNPFNPRVILRFERPAAGAARLEIFDARGRRVRRLPDGEPTAGVAEIAWDGRDDAGRLLPAAVYLARLTVGDAAATARVTLAR